MGLILTINLLEEPRDSRFSLWAQISNLKKIDFKWRGEEDIEAVETPSWSFFFESIGESLALWIIFSLKLMEMVSLAKDVPKSNAIGILFQYVVASNKPPFLFGVITNTK